MHNPLNDPDIDGNTLNLHDVDGVVHEDQYLCEHCSYLVSNVNWLENEQLCKDCCKELYG